ncbi:MAG TPA: glycosyltransferase [Spirochaetota bacterium]|nr:glycosyltransferase [Spirochaetota bacterium]HPI88797.1 glycosyltransferase [Spirochaetota bacterium]HPR47129.1 glycosyltransferase [Spirochaetota bacterium]
MSEKKIVLITAAFPYYPGEQFLETEIRYWGEHDGIKLIIMPVAQGEQIRDIPPNITLDYTLINRPLSIFNKILNSMKAIFTPSFWIEVVKEKTFSPDMFLTNLATYSRLYRYKTLLYEYFLNNQIDVFYTYWFTEVTYALQRIKRIHRCSFKVCTRVHGFDLYRERRKDNYMPLRRRYLDNIDKIFTITDKAKDYLITTYGYNKGLLETKRLGVDDQKIITSPSDPGFFHIVSCAFMVPVKNIDKIIKSIAVISDIINDKIIWTHIGDGPLEPQLLSLIDELEFNKKNIKHNFTGELKNSEVYSFYEKNKIDVFINTSESEGVPVSIMEAMSCHIPVIAPNIGGISDMIIDGYNGILLSSQAHIEEIVEALTKIVFFKNKKNRTHSYEQYKKNYDAKKNYNSFINTLEIL